MDDRLLTVREAAEMLGVAPSTIYQWSYERRIPSVKLMGRALRFRLSAIEKIIRAGDRPALRDRHE
jgi:excisionase family DNA binding protein